MLPKETNDTPPSERAVLSAGRRAAMPWRRKTRSGDAEGRHAARREGCRLSRDITVVVLDMPPDAFERADVPPAELCHVRHVAMYLAHVIFQVPLSAIAQEFGRDRTSVAYAIGRIEDRREDRAFDTLMERLERLAASCRPLVAGAAGASEDR